MKDNFSEQADHYAKYRPDYPAGLFDFILGFVDERALAWDSGTGNGQSAAELAKYFRQVHATDISRKQIENAIKKENINFAVEPAESVSLPAAVVDLVTVSQALHWFDRDRFYGEVKRVCKQKAIIAVWTYGLIETDPQTDELIRNYHFNTLAPYWDKEREHVDNGYIHIPFPFKQIAAPPFFIDLNWNLLQFEGYLQTWSALQKFLSVNHFNPVTDLVQQIMENWPAEEVRPVRFPLTLKIGYVH